ISLGTGEAPLVIEIAGDDLEQIRGLTEQAVAKLPEVGEVLSWETNFEAGRPEVNVVVDRIRAGIYEVQMQTVSEQLKDKLEGRDAGQFEHDGELREISIKLPPPDIRELGNLYIDNNQQKVRLDELSTLSASVSPREIYRRNQTRIGKISLQLKGNKPLDQVVSEVRAALAGIEFPPNYRYLITGEEQKRAESFASLKFALLLSIALIYMVLAAQFESLRHPFTILLTIPLAAVGAIVIFFVLGMPLNIMAYIGIIMLVGIAVNDSIILVDAINQLRRDGAALDEAILDAGQRRIRPIIMTSLTTILALL
ncbi:MAG: efflux RND transporter permease subunit, partial [Calditrichaeota bacterium]|nr:efflux RND transporter permease subunit [Calditrichota bacterium]